MPPGPADDCDAWQSSDKNCSDSDEELQIIAPAPSATETGFCDSCNLSSPKEEYDRSGSEELEILSPSGSEEFEAFSFMDRFKAYAHVLRRPGVPFPYVDYDPDNPSGSMTSTAEPPITDDNSDSQIDDVCMGHEDDPDAGLDDSDSDSENSSSSSHCIDGGNGNGDNINIDNDDDDEENNYAHSVGDLSTSVGSEQFSPSEADSDHTYVPLSETSSETIMTTPKTSSKRSYNEI